MAPEPAQWYPDPIKDGQLRYWDGNKWTEQVRKLQDNLPTSTEQSINQAATIITNKVNELNRPDSAASKSERLSRRQWEQKLIGTSNWEIAQRNKPKIASVTTSNVSIFDDGRKESSSIFDDGDDQQLWGESDRPNPLKTTWRKIPSRWRKPIAIVALVALAIWIGPSLINLASSAIGLNEKRKIAQQAVEAISPSGQKYNQMIGQVWGQVESQLLPGHLLYTNSDRPFSIYQCPLGQPLPGPGCKTIKTNNSQNQELVFANNLALAKGKLIKPPGAVNSIILAPLAVSEGDVDCLSATFQNNQGKIITTKIQCP